MLEKIPTWRELKDENTRLKKQLDLYRKAINDFDDYFEYSMQSKKDQEKVHKILDELCRSLL